MKSCNGIELYKLTVDQQIRIAALNASAVFGKEYAAEEVVDLAQHFEYYIRNGENP